MVSDNVMVYDSVDVSAIPREAKYVLGYVDGIYANIELIKIRFPNAKIITVTVTGYSRAMMADVERGAIDTKTLKTWIAHKYYTGPFPVVYCSDNIKPVVSYAIAYVYKGQWAWWAADWTGVPHIVPTSEATQYADSTMLKKDYDLSIATPSLIAALFPEEPVPENLAVKPKTYTNFTLSQAVVTVQLDGNGNGWTDSPISPDSQIISVLPTTAYPPQEKGYVNVPRFSGVSPNNSLVFVGGVPHGKFDMFVWYV